MTLPLTLTLSEDEQMTLRRLESRLKQDIRGNRRDGILGFDSLDAYYRGMQRLEQLGLAVPDDLRQFVTIVAWPGIQVDAIEERCDLEGFQLKGKSEVDEDLAAIWDANNLEDESQMAHLDSLIFRRSYSCVGTGETRELPLITVESPLEMVHEWSPRDRKVTDAARFYDDVSGSTKERRATFYRDGVTTWLIRGKGGWQVEERDDHGYPCPVEVFINRERTHDRYGFSEMARVIGLTDAAARALTNAQVATEVMALPQRWAAGMTQADFKDAETGKVKTAWESYFGAIWATASKEAKFGQFDAADLQNFETIVRLYAQLVSGLTGLPMRYLGQLTDNPPSADGIRADEARLVKTCERKNRSNGASWSRTMRTAMLFARGTDDPELASMRAIWRDPATPTRAQTADAAVKKFEAGVTTLRQTRRDCGYTATEIDNMEREDELAAADPTLERIARQFTQIGNGQPQNNGQQPQPVTADAGT